MENESKFATLFEFEKKALNLASLILFKLFPSETSIMSEKQGSAIPGAGTNGRPIVFFDISIGDQPAGRIKMELFSDIVPK